MANKNYYISDLHFFCTSQLDNGGRNFDKRPFQTLDEMHTYIKDKWNAKVTNGDSVYILGDVSKRGKNDDLIALVATLKGRKVLVKGNHDDLSDYRYKQLFSEITDYKEISETVKGKNYKLVMSHYPILMWKDQHKGSILLYGHTHNTVEDHFFQECIHKMNDDPLIHHETDPVFQAINVGCMLPYMNYEPRTLEELFNRKKASL